MKNAAKVLNKWFWAWVGIAAIMMLVMIVVGNEAGNNTAIIYGCSGVIMATLMIMPLRDWLYRLIVWALDYVSSINTRFKDRINQHATYNRLVNPLVREENVGFYRAVKVVINVITMILALLWLVFARTSYNVVYSFVRTWELIFRGQISYLAILVNLILSFAFAYLVFWFAGQILNGKIYNKDGTIKWTESWWKIVLAVVGLYAKIIISALLKQYTVEMLIAKLVFWTVVIGFPVLVYEIWSYIQRNRSEISNSIQQLNSKIRAFIRRNFLNPPTPPAP